MACHMHALDINRARFGKKIGFQGGHGFSKRVFFKIMFAGL